MKKLLLLLITLTAFINVSYASFPVVDTLQVKQEALQTDEIKEYHANLVKLGIDISDCKCESCRLDKNNKQTASQQNVKTVFISAIVLSAIIGIWFVIWLMRGYKCLDNRDNCSKSRAKFIAGVPAEFFWMGILSWVNVALYVKAWRMKKRINKQQSK